MNDFNNSVSGEAIVTATTTEENLINYLMNIDSRPSWVKKDVFYFENCGNCLDIVMFGSYHIKLQYDPSYSSMDAASADDGCGYGREDLEYAADIMYNRDVILALAKEAGLLSTDEDDDECVA